MYVYVNVCVHIQTYVYTCLYMFDIYVCCRQRLLGFMFVYMNVCVYQCVCIWTCVCVHWYIQTYVYTCLCICVCISICAYTLIYTYIGVYTDMYTHMFVCINVCTHMFCVYECIRISMCEYIYKQICIHVCIYRTASPDIAFPVIHMCIQWFTPIGWLQLVGSLKIEVSFAKEPNKRDYILQKRPIILRSLLTVATPYAREVLSLRKSMYAHVYRNICVYVYTCIEICVYMYTYLYIYMYIEELLPSSTHATIFYLCISMYACVHIMHI